MKLIFIYGPPAVGKLTVGQRLAELTGYRLFHNHLTVPTVNAIFAKESPARSRLLKELRVVAIAAAAEEGIDLIFTAAYSGGDEDEAFIQRIADAVEGAGGTMLYVQLTAPLEVLLQRVAEESREKLGLQKMTNPDEYRARIERKKRDLLVSVIYDGVLRLDTTTMTAEEAAAAIVRHFGL